MPETLLAPTFLFRFSVPCHRQDPAWSVRGSALPERCRVPSFGELEGKPLFADVRAAWNAHGVGLAVRVTAKRQKVWCRDSRLEDSDGLHVWIDTRDTQTIHRASRFCHRFIFLPQGASGGREPIARSVPIHRARENPRSIDMRQLKVRAEERVDGYLLDAFIPAEALTGFDPQEHPRLGFTYAVTDRELGWQTFSVGPEFPFQEDPSLWGTLELVE